MIISNEIIGKLIEDVIAQIKKEYDIIIVVNDRRNINKNVRFFVSNDDTTICLGLVKFSRKGFSWRNSERSATKYFKNLNYSSIRDILCKKIAFSLSYKGRFVLPRLTPHNNDTHVINGIRLNISDNALRAIKNHIYKSPKLECGGYLIGRMDISEDGKNVLASVDDIYHDDSVGSAADYTFTSQYALAAYSYCIKNYSGVDNKKKIIGNYHSHASFDAFFSGTDRIMIFSSSAPEFYLVFSPSHKHVTALFKNKEKLLFKVKLEYDASEFSMKEATIPFESILNS